MNLSCVVWSLIPALVLFSAPALADVVPRMPDECPSGSGVEYSCGFAFCAAFVCETDADCNGGDCEPVEACFGPVEGFQPPQTEHGGPCLRDDTCGDEKLSCQTLGLCLSFGEATSGDATTGGATTGAASTGAASTGGASTGGASTGGASTGTGGPSGTSTGVGSTGSVPTGGELPGTGTTASNTTTAGGSGEVPGDKGGGCGCSLAGSADLLGLLGLAALRRRRSRSTA